MPITPFHLGPGALFKGVGGARFSLLVFGGAQVLMDSEPLVRMVRGDAVLHGASHTVGGAFAIAAAAAILGRPVGNAVLRRFAAGARPIGRGVAATSALIGTLSHIVLDAAMHRDMHPSWPLAEGNPVLGIVSVRTLYLACVVAGAIGIGIIAARAWHSALLPEGRG